MQRSTHTTTLVSMLVGTTSGCFDPYHAVLEEGSTSSEVTAAFGSAGSAGEATMAPPPPPGTGSDSFDDSTSSTGHEDTAGDPGCNGTDGEIDPSCDPATPYCLAGTCVSCTALPPNHCTSLDETTPYCDHDLGTCTACSAHEHCASGACRILTGQCFSTDRQLWINGNATDCTVGDGSPPTPYCTISEALDTVATRPAGEAWMVRVAGGPDPYVGTLMPTGSHPLAIIGQAGNQRARVDGDGAATLDLLSPGIELYLHSLDVHYTGAGAQTLRCGFGNELWMSQVNIIDGPALVLANCSVTLKSTLVQGGDVRIGPDGGLLAMFDSLVEQGSNDELVVRTEVQFSHSLLRRLPGGVGIHLDDAMAHLVLDNSILQGDTDGPVLHVDTGDFDIAFSTLVSGVECVSPGPSTIRSSIVAGLACGSAAVHHSLVDAGLEQGTNNVLLPAGTLPMLFVDPAGALGDYHVLPDSPAKDVAIWQGDDALLDIDGDPRAGELDVPDYAGADLP